MDTSEVETSEWQDLSVPQLKIELTKLTSLSQQLRDLGLINAAAEATKKAEALRSYQQKRMPSGQRLDMLNATHRRATQSRERAQAHLDELEKKLCEARASLEMAQKAEEEAAQAVRQVQQAMVSTTLEEAGTVSTDSATTQRIACLLMQGLQHATAWSPDQAPNLMLSLVKDTLTQVASAPGTPSVLSPPPPPEVMPTQVDSTQAAESGFLPHGPPPLAHLQMPAPQNDGDQSHGYAAAGRDRAQRAEPYSMKPMHNVNGNDPMQTAWEHA